MRILPFLIALFPTAVSAHAAYVLPPEELANHSGRDFSFLLEPLSHWNNLALMVVVLIVVAVVYAVATRVHVSKQKMATICAKAESYRELIPWMLRLSLGLALIGAGSLHMLISPAMPGFPGVAFLQVLIGFLLLAGFLIIPATLVAIVLFFVALQHSWVGLGNLEFLAACVVLLFLNDPRPGVDDLLGIRFHLSLERLKEFVPLILRIGIGGAMIFSALYEKLLNPHLMAQVVEQYHLSAFVSLSTQMWVLSFGVVELLIGLLLLFGFYTRTVTAIAFLVLAKTFFIFGEQVYAHVTLFGVFSVLFVTGGGRGSIDYCHKRNV